jgi:hypothetical protein
VPLVANKQRKRKTDTVLADAVDRLLVATKRKMLREKGHIDCEKLARDGFSAALIERLKMLGLHPSVARRFDAW